MLTVLASPAGADLSDEKVSTTQDKSGNTTVRVSSDGSVPQPGARRGGSTVTCNYYATFFTDTDATQFTDPGAMTPGQFYWADCRDAADGSIMNRFFQFDPAQPAISAFALALAAQSTLVLPFPVPRTNPARDQDQLVGIDTWLWVDPATWQPVTASASIPGLSATVIATPTRVVWAMGDDQPPVVCDGPGTPYDTSLPESAQSTDCRHLYQVRDVYEASATIEYTITWSASNGEGGTLAGAGRTTQFPMSVAERQAVGA